MCRNIRVLHAFEPPTTKEEVRAAALQYVRKVTGITKPSMTDSVAFERAIDEITATTERVLGSIVARPSILRTREGERARARLRWEKRAREGG